jgi:hypothetical protein
MARRLSGAACLLIAIVIVAPPAKTYASEWLAVDSCLDSGGSFDYGTMKCDHTTNHPYVPFDLRHPGMMRSLQIRALFLAPLGLLGVALLVWPARRVVA